MRGISMTAALVAMLTSWAGAAWADPDKDESGNGRGRGGYERSYGTPDRYGYGYERPRRERRAFKQEYDDGNCKYERKVEKNGDYEEEMKCRDGRSRWVSPAYGYDYRPYPSYGYRY